MSNLSTSPQDWRQSPLLRLLLIGGLVLLLQIPILRIESLIFERNERYSEAAREVTEKWGDSQSLASPLLVVPYRSLQEVHPKGQTSRLLPVTRYAMFTPQSQHIAAVTDSTQRYRGIYEISLYSARFDIEAQFSTPDLSQWHIAEEDIDWDNTRLLIEVGDMSAMQLAPDIRWGNHTLTAEPAPRGFIIPIARDLLEQPGRLTMQLNLQGSQSLTVHPLGKNVSLDVAGNWPQPSFQGDWLPTDRHIDDRGFQAGWKIPFLALGNPIQWHATTASLAHLELAGVGVDYLPEIDSYRRCARAVKYQILFIGMTFAILWLFEVLQGLKIHPIQYLLTGASLCLFYLLLLSLAEHMAFFTAYILAALAVIGQVGLYARSALGQGRRASLLSAVLGLLYLYLLTLLQERDFALLIGSLGLFAALAAAMYLTRKVDWYKLGTRAAAETVNQGN